MKRLKYVQIRINGCCPHIGYPRGLLLTEVKVDNLFTCKIARFVTVFRIENKYYKKL